jgi:hypothetical protein
MSLSAWGGRQQRGKSLLLRCIDGSGALAQGLCDELLKQIQLLGLHVDKRQVQPCEENPGILGREKDYEGGFVMLTVSQAK